MQRLFFLTDRSSRGTHSFESVHRGLKRRINMNKKPAYYQKTKKHGIIRSAKNKAIINGYNGGI